MATDDGRTQGAHKQERRLPSSAACTTEGPHMHAQRPLRQLSESDLLWIGAFAQALRRLSPRLAGDEQGVRLDGWSREALEQPAMRALSPEQAARRWWEQGGADRDRRQPMHGP